MSVRDLLLLSALYAMLTVAILIAGMRAGYAETYGWRMEIRACREDACRLLPVSRRRWPAQFACDIRADLIERLGSAPHGRTLHARCVSVQGLRGA